MALFEIGKAVEPARADIPFIFSSDEDEDFAICKSPDKLKQLLDRLKLGQSVHYVSDGDWSMHDLVGELLKIYQPADVWLTTYAIRELAIRQLVMAMQDEVIRYLYMLVDVRANIRTPEVYELARLNATQIRLISLHSKVTVIKSPVGCVTIVGSANWTTNPRIEAGIVTLNPAAAEFHSGWIQKVSDNAEIFK